MQERARIDDELEDESDELEEIPEGFDYSKAEWGKYRQLYMQGTNLIVDSALGLAKARKAAGLTQEQLAERAGMTQEAVARAESGQQMPSVPTLYRLARALGITFTITPTGIKVRRHKAA